ncbi:hypothetical protein ACVGV6_00365, partial [Enterobacter sichuanensis]
RQSGEGGVETFFGHQVALGALGAVRGKPPRSCASVFSTTPGPAFGCNPSRFKKLACARPKETVFICGGRII